MFYGFNSTRTKVAKLHVFSALILARLLGSCRGRPQAAAAGDLRRQLQPGGLPVRWPVGSLGFPRRLFHGALATFAHFRGERAALRPTIHTDAGTSIGHAVGEF